MFKSLRRPQIDDWRSDEAFARHFLEGVHPLVSVGPLPLPNTRKGQHLTWMTNTNYVSQALRLVRSLEEVKEELRGLTVRVDGQEETVSGLLESGR